MINDIPVEASRNQIGFVSRDKVKENYWCFPSARPFVQIDTMISLKNSNEIIGDWRLKCGRTIEYKDSVNFSDSTFYRSSKLLSESDDDVLVRFTENKVYFYVKTINTTTYKKVFTKQYKILNGRYLLIYNFIKTTSGTAFIGITNEKLLIWNQYSINMDTYFNFFKRWVTKTNQMIFEKI